MVVVYLHGFRSSPASKKGQILRKAFEESLGYRAPDLNVGPLEAQKVMLETVKDLNPKDLCLVGSSLGGFYATWLAERIGCKAVLLNPATEPWAVINDYLGLQTIHNTNRTIFVKPEYADQAREMATEATDPSRYLVFLSTADEVLDWTKGQKKYSQCEQVILPNNTHEIESFEDCLPAIKAFLKD